MQSVIVKVDGSYNYHNTLKELIRILPLYAKGEQTLLCCALSIYSAPYLQLRPKAINIWRKVEGKHGMKLPQRPNFFGWHQIM
jgi:hypothetical protein